MNPRALRQHATRLWTAEGQADAGIPKLLKKYDFSTRMTVIALADGGLFLHSPVRLSDGLRAELDEIGPVRAIVAPNKTHHLFVGEYVAAYPEARLYGALGLPNKRKDLVFFGLLGDEPRPEWTGEIEQRMVRGAPMLNEVVFFHPATRTLIVTDLVFNVPEGGVWGVPIVCRLMGASGNFGPHRFIRWAIRDKAAARASLGFVMRWDFDRVIVAHGDILETGGKKMFRDAFGFILGAASRTK
jgi:hypothetical protein